MCLRTFQGLCYEFQTVDAGSYNLCIFYFPLELRVQSPRINRAFVRNRREQLNSLRTHANTTPAFCNSFFFFPIF